MISASGKILFVLLALPFIAIAQILPKDGSRLHYRLIGFAWPEQSSCTLEIAKGYQNSESSFFSNLVTHVNGKDGKATIEVPEFGCDYTWRTVSHKSRTDSTTSEFHHFATLANKNLDTGNTRLRIASNDHKYDGYFFVDATATLYDMQGAAVWFVPGLESTSAGAANIRDLKMTPQGTITYIQGDQIREMDYQGNIIWTGPNSARISGDNTEHFHHELTRLANGHYMVLGSETVRWPLPAFRIDSSLPSQDGMITKENDTFRQQMLIGTVIEYDDKDNVVWSWRSSAYFRTSDLYTHYTSNGKFPTTDVHENAFRFDEKNKILYVGFRDISRILKVRYPEGTVMASYGNKWDENSSDMGTDLFCGQHSIDLDAKGNLCIFNNNAHGRTELPRIELLKETKKTEAPLSKVWEYTIGRDAMSSTEMRRVDAMSKKIERSASKTQTPNKLRMTSGGNVSVLPDGSYFVCSGTDPGTIMIVSGDKKIHWSALPERKINNEWGIFPTYRASFVSHQQLVSSISKPPAR